MKKQAQDELMQRFKRSYESCIEKDIDFLIYPEMSMLELSKLKERIEGQGLPVNMPQGICLGRIEFVYERII